MKQGFNFGLFVRGKGGNDKIAAATINLGSTKGRGSSTRMFNYCNQRSANPSECINQFINVTSAAPTPPPTCDYTFTGTGGELTSEIVNENIGTARNICIVGYISIGDSAFLNKTRITSITIGNTVTSISYRAFYNCSRLSSVIIPESVTSIDVNVFYSCTRLTSINVADSNTYYSSTDGVLFNKNQTTFMQYPIGKSGSSYTIPDSVTSIDQNAFDGCIGLTSVTIGNSVTSIGYQAFEYSGLTSVTIPDSVTSIGAEAFYGCTSLTSINVADSNTYYSSTDGVLFDKDKTTLIQYPAGKTGSSYTIPDLVTTIGASAFSDCTNLTSVTIPNSVTIIGQDAFYNCTGLTSITIPNSVTSISSNAFISSGLTTVTIASDNPLGISSPDTGVDFFGAINVTTIEPSP